jgi:hypothetical protein
MRDLREAVLPVCPWYSVGDRPRYSLERREAMDFLERFEQSSKRMKKGWAARREKRAATTYNLSLTVTQKEAAPGTDVALKLDMVDIGTEAAGVALEKIRQAALDGQLSLPRHAADLLGLSRTRGGVVYERNGTVPKVSDSL